MDYPRDYIIPNQDIVLDTAFVVMPFRREFDWALGVIIDICDEIGIKAKRADDFARQDFIMSNILEGIARSEIIIVDITGGNPNVFYELGIAHSLRSRQSVIIITRDEDLSKSPFDIRHWSILQYKTDNKASFRTQLKEKINSCRESIDYEKFILQLLKNHAFENSLIQDFVGVSVHTNAQRLELICNIIANKIDIAHCNRDEIQSLNNYLTVLGDYCNGKFAKIAWKLKELVYTSDFVLSQYIDTIKKMFLLEWKRSDLMMENTDYWEFVADICFKIVEKQHSDKKDAINWLVSYLKNTRMGRIDRVRTKIEDFLLMTQDKDIDCALVGILGGDSRTARESAIDICGQKRVAQSVNYLLLNLSQNDPDPHIIRSSINALARMHVTIAGPIILQWMKNNRDKWGTQAVSASLKTVAEKALASLDEDSYNQLINL